MIDAKSQFVSTKLNDGTWICDNIDMKEYLVSLGFDLKELASALLVEYGWIDTDYILRDDCDDYERYYSEVTCAYQNLVEEIKAMNKKFLSGRKLTKAKYVTELERMLENGLDY